MFKKTLVFLFSFLFLLSGAVSVSASCLSAKVDVVARNQDGGYIPDISFEIYEQVFDVDNKPKPGTRVAGGRTSEITGKGSVSFVPKTDKYALKMWDKNPNLGEFWYYDQIILNCGDEVVVTEVLSGIRLSYYKSNGDLLKNIKGGLYTQRFDVENNPIKESRDLIGYFDTSNEGSAYFYIGGSQYDLDNNSTGLFVAEAKNDNGAVFKKYDISVVDEQINYVNYIFGEVRLNLKDSTSKEALPNYRIEIYKQAYEEGNKKKLGLHLKSINTNSDGVAIFENQEDLLAIAVKNTNGVYEYFWEKEIIDQKRVDYDLYIDASSIGSDSGDNSSPVIDQNVGVLNLHAVNADNEALKNRSVSLYVQKKENNKNILVKKIKEVKTNNDGDVKFETAGGLFAVAVKDDLGMEQVFYDVNIKNGTANKKTVTMSKIGITVLDSSGKAVAANVDVYKLINTNGDNYKRDVKIKSLSVAKTSDYIISSGPYLFSMRSEWGDYGQALYVGNATKQSITIRISSAMEVKSDKVYVLKSPAVVKLPVNSDTSNNLSGKILLKVEGNGEAYYVHPDKNKRYYLKNGDTAFKIMRNFGLGISDADLKKISVGIDSRFNKNDTDFDGLGDSLERALGTDPNKKDTDGDSYVDGVEVRTNYNPLGLGALKIDKKLLSRLKGRIVLQVQSKGEAWYINPTDGKRYYMGSGSQAFEIMKYLSLGVKNSVLDGIPEGKL